MIRPLFVFGIARSGTNLLARILNGHPAVALALDPLLPYFKSLRNRIVETRGTADIKRTFDPDGSFEDYYFLSRGPATLDLIAGASLDLQFATHDEARLRAAVVSRAGLESPGLAELLQQVKGGDYGAFLASALQIIGRSKREQGVLWQGSKEVWVIDFLPVLARAYPEARFFVIERDPRAIVASLLAMADKDASQAAHFVSYVRHWRKFVAQARHYAADKAFGSRIRIVTYEALVRNAAEETKRVCAHLELDFDEEILRVSSEGWAGNSSYGRNTGIYEQSLEHWHATLSQDLLHAVDFHCAPEMALTPYRARAEAGRITPPLLQTVRRAASETGSWRSDSGHVAFDVGGELLRHALLDGKGSFDAASVRECFLFPGTYQAIRTKMQLAGQ